MSLPDHSTYSARYSASIWVGWLSLGDSPKRRTAKHLRDRSFPGGVSG